MARLLNLADEKERAIVRRHFEKSYPFLNAEQIEHVLDGITIDYHEPADEPEHECTCWTEFGGPDPDCPVHGIQDDDEVEADPTDYIDP